MLLEQNNNFDQYLQDIRDRNESYLSTIYALHGFVRTIKRKTSIKNTEVVYSIGRRMHYSKAENNKDICTPDLVVQISPKEGIVGEAKLSICQNIDDHWQKYIDQIKRYDDDLLGWWTKDEKIEKLQMVLITEISFSSKVSEYFKSKVDASEIILTHPLAIIEFTKQSKSREYLFFRKRWGTLPFDVEKDFDNGLSISLEALIFENKEKKFYDAKPQDVEYIMEILWQNIFNTEAVNNESGLVIFDNKEKTWNIPICVDDLVNNVQKLYGSTGSEDREVEYPKKAWIREALDKFVLIGLAKKENNNGEYTIFFKKYSRPMERFIQLAQKKQKRIKANVKQLTLFITPNEDK